ncbi:hypothetical protein PO124_04890 [Bacillus licheniformis]|nr:hypothetical protein [Bacillus licheniformis]
MSLLVLKLVRSRSLRLKRRKSWFQFGTITLQPSEFMKSA